MRDRSATRRNRLACRRAAWTRCALTSAAITLTGRPLRAAAQSLPAPLATFLQRTVGLDSVAVQDVIGGTPVVKVLATSDGRELAVFGIVRIGVPRPFYIQRVTDFPSSLRDHFRLEFATFSDPPVASDVTSLSLPHDDVQDLKRCQPGSCKVKLPAEAIAHLRATVDFDGPSGDSIVDAYFRARMLDYVAGYRVQGDAALVVYDDQQAKIAAAQVFQSMLSRSPYMYQYAPSLERYLEAYPRDRPPGIAEALFWSEDDLPGLKPTVTVTHEVVYSPPDLPGSTLIASKLLYAAHYLDGGLDLTAVVDVADDRGTTPAGIYLALLRRLHFDNLPSGGLLDLRRRVIGKLRDRTAGLLRDARTTSEQAYATAAGRSH